MTQNGQIASHKPWSKMDRLCFTHAVKEKMYRWTDCVLHKSWARMDRLLDTTRGKGKNGQIDCASHKPWPRMDRLCFTQAVLQRTKMDRWTDCASHKPWQRKNGQMDRLCFTQAVTQNEQTVAVANAKRCPIILCLSSYFNLIKSAL